MEKENKLCYHRKKNKTGLIIGREKGRASSVYYYYKVINDKCEQVLWFCDFVDVICE